jgi:hypothetical protein
MIKVKAEPSFNLKGSNFTKAASYYSGKKD